jgi:hypothetical protein
VSASTLRARFPPTVTNLQGVIVDVLCVVKKNTREKKNARVRTAVGVD